MLVLADARPRMPPPGELLGVALPLIGALLAGALVIYLFDRWRKRRAARADLCDPNDQLSHFRSLYEKGEMSREEYEQVRTLLAAQLRQEVGGLNSRPVEPTPIPEEASPTETNVQSTPTEPQSLPPPTNPTP
jgi:hypothetical protein